MATGDDRTRARLARDVEAAVTRASPEWTSTNSHDPGVTLVQLFAFLAETLLYRVELSAPARHAASDLGRRIGSLGESGTGGDCVEGLQRVRYFTGQMLGAAEFQAEQDYVRDRLARRSRLLGAGVVSGLEVTVESGDARLVIAPGLAVVPDGNEICIERPLPLALPTSGTTWFVQVAYRELPCRIVPSPSTTEASGEFSRIVETHAASLVETADASAVTLARITRRRGAWRVDTGFAPPRRRG